MIGPRFVEPPRSLFRRRERVDPRLLAVAGAVVALLVLLITVAMFERA